MIDDEHEFFTWWNGDEMVSGLNVEKDSPLYWAMQGWQARVRYENSGNNPMLPLWNIKEWK
jgi:hypothetical protein